MALFRSSGPVSRLSFIQSVKPSLPARVCLARFSLSRRLKSAGNDPVGDALRNGAGAASSLLAPVDVPDDPHGVLHSSHPAASILEHSSIVVHRQLNMMNAVLGFEEANKYAILDPNGTHIGSMAERELGMGNALSRQMLRTHRQFTTHIFDRSGKEVLRFHRPFSFINSAIRIYDPVDPNGNSDIDSNAAQGSTAITDQPVSLIPSTVAVDNMPFIGQVQQIWAPLRRKYGLSLRKPSAVPEQIDLDGFAYIDSPFLSWDFSLRSTSSDAIMGAVDRNFAGFGRELFTESGVYALRMDSATVEAEQQAREVAVGKGAPSVDLLPRKGSAMTLDQRAVMLAMAVTIDYDYFSRDRDGFIPLPFLMGGGEGTAAGGAAAGEAAGGVAGAGAAAAASEAGALGGAGAASAGIARGAGAITAEEAAGGAAGAGALAGYDALQRGRQSQQDGSAADVNTPEQSFQQPYDGSAEEVWDHREDPYEQTQAQDRSSNAPKDDDSDDWFGGGKNDRSNGEGEGKDGGDGDGDGDGGGWLSGVSEFFDS